MRPRQLWAVFWSCLALVAVATDMAPTGGAAAGSPSPVRFSIAITGHRLRYRGVAVVLAIRMRTGASARSAGVGLTQSGWPDRRVLGSPLAFTRPRVAGAGRITSGFGPGGGGLPHVPICSRGTFVDGPGGVDVSLPANSVTTLRYRVRLAAPPWPGLRATVGAYAYVPAVGQGIPARTLGTRRLTTVGPTGVRISLFAAHGTIHRRGISDPIVPRGRQVLIAGTTQPRISHERVRIAAEAYIGRHAERLRDIEIGARMTASDGRFAIRWRPSQPGTYMVTARLSHSGDGDLADRGCDLSLIAR
jgi:hypothetical protein